MSSDVTARSPQPSPRPKSSHLSRIHRLGHRPLLPRARRRRRTTWPAASPRSSSWHASRQRACTRTSSPRRARPPRWAWTTRHPLLPRRHRTRRNLRGPRNTGSTVDLSFQILRGDYTATNVPGGDAPSTTAASRSPTTARSRSPSARTRPVSDRTTTSSRRRCVDAGGARWYGDWTERKRFDLDPRVDTRGTAPEARHRQDLPTVRWRAKMLLHASTPGSTSRNGSTSTNRSTPFTAQAHSGHCTQFSSVGHYRLADDEAMIITVPRSTVPGLSARQHVVHLLDYVNHQTSSIHNRRKWIRME